MGRAGAGILICLPLSQIFNSHPLALLDCLEGFGFDARNDGIHLGFNTVQGDLV